MTRGNNSRTFTLVVLIIALVGVSAWALARKSPQSHGFAAKPAGRTNQSEVKIERDVPALMPDGVALRADIYRPNDDKKHPVILVRTPYSKQQQAPMGPYFAKRGYVFVVQDVRGKYKSDGKFNAWAQETDDGVATLDWLVKQLWCDQNIGAWGPSYLGFTSLLLAPSGHPALKAVVNVSGPGDIYRTLYPGGSLHLAAIMPWTLMMANGRYQTTPNSLAMPIRDLLKTTPLSEADRQAGFTIPFWQTVSNHPGNSKFWTDTGISKKYDQIKVPILHITGWNDFICRHTIEVYNEIRNASPQIVQKLHVGPWHHDQPGTGGTQSGDEEFGPAAALDEEAFYELAIRWFDHYLKGIDNGVTSDPAAKFFVMGRNAWDQNDHWPPDDVVMTDWYFAAAQSGDRASGTLATTKPNVSETVSFIYDPYDPVPTRGGANIHFFRENLGPKDQREFEKRDDVLLFTSGPMDGSIQIVGPLEVTLFASSDAKDTDFTAKLVEVRADGYARIIEDGIIRGRYRDSQFKAEMMTPGEVYAFKIELGATAIEIAQGHRLRVEISSSNFPKYSRNPNTGEEPMTASTLQSANQTIYTGGSKLSRITLPMRKVQ